MATCCIVMDRRCHDHVCGWQLALAELEQLLDPTQVYCTFMSDLRYRFPTERTCRLYKPNENRLSKRDIVGAFDLRIVRNYI